MRKISTHNAPQAIGAYSQALVANGFVFTSGQIALTPAGEFAAGGVEDQARQVFANIAAVLDASGSGVGKIVKTTLFLVNIADFEAVNALYAEFLGDHKPARSTVAVKELPRNALIEMECVALI
ncbi:MAG: Rid family detoxifying hydrolase [Helicobacteraceae bacterium]|jgi:2-iminobutanoate/2-iminopropanoate deaminase|nr:Rid family detoxifying hydrolase [Helicobacteraceae bacterium]